MKRRKILELGLIVLLTFSLAGCGSRKETSLILLSVSIKDSFATSILF